MRPFCQADGRVVFSARYGRRLPQRKLLASQKTPASRAFKDSLPNTDFGLVIANNICGNRKLRSATNMKANTNNVEYIGDDSSLAEPHFDDERTLLTAQPVVPLEEIRTTQRLGKHRTLGIAIFCSLLVGFLSASFMYKHRNQKTADEIVSSAVPGASGAGKDGGSAPPENAESNLNAGAAALPQGESVAPRPQPEPLLSAVIPAKTKLVKAPVPLKPKRTATSPQPRRESKREIEHAADDRKRPTEGAWRIREIFEGSRRP